ncbi:hypothetical protein SDC9_108121 [bioreactor metagenome]|uniref:Uncharacterized protein n=1 Tax=bioreactor metagenome TaxID=1076179 RepID=A0A645BDK5_9ZZZZ
MKHYMIKSGFASSLQEHCSKADFERYLQFGVAEPEANKLTEELGPTWMDAYIDVTGETAEEGLDMRDRLWRVIDALEEQLEAPEARMEALEDQMVESMQRDAMRNKIDDINRELAQLGGRRYKMDGGDGRLSLLSVTQAPPITCQSYVCDKVRSETVYMYYIVDDELHAELHRIKTHLETRRVEVADAIVSGKRPSMIHPALDLEHPVLDALDLRHVWGQQHINSRRFFVHVFDRYVAIIDSCAGYVSVRL